MILLSTLKTPFILFTRLKLIDVTKQDTQSELTLYKKVPHMHKTLCCNTRLFNIASNLFHFNGQIKTYNIFEETYRLILSARKVLQINTEIIILYHTHTPSSLN